jgi:hypothetical protein
VKRLLALAVVLGAVSPTAALPPAVQSITVSDVTPRGFSVVWLATPGAQPSLRVFEAPSCEVLVASVALEVWPSLGGAADVGTAASARGVMKVRVSGLAPDTEYCVQTTTRVGADVTVAPLEPLGARTASRTAKGRDDGGPGLEPRANDLMRFDVVLSPSSIGSSGLLLLARVEGASSPISAFIGDGVDDDANPATPTSRVLLDLNNLYAGAPAETLDLLGDGTEGLTFLELGGPERVVPVHARLVPPDRNLSEVGDPLPCAAQAAGGSCDGLLADPTDDDELNLEDSAAIAAFVAGAGGEPACPVCADVNFDGQAGMKDALAIAQFLLGLGTLP